MYRYVFFYWLSLLSPFFSNIAAHATRCQARRGADCRIPVISSFLLPPLSSSACRRLLETVVVDTFFTYCNFLKPTRTRPFYVWNDWFAVKLPRVRCSAPEMLIIFRSLPNNHQQAGYVCGTCAMCNRNSCGCM